MFTVQEQDTTMYDHPIKQYIDAGAGDDTVTIKSNSTHDIPNFFNVDVELGPGNDHIDVTFEVGVSRASVVNVTDSGSLADLDRIDFTFIDSPASSDPTVIQIDPTEPGETFTHKIDTQGISASNRLTYVPSAFDILSIQAERNSFYFFVSGPLTIDEVILNGGGGSDLFHISASALVNDNLSINGSTGNDRLTVTGTDEADTFVIDNQSRISINGSEFTEDMDSRLVGVELFFLDGGNRGFEKCLDK
jgi:hypothetical protein